MGERRTEEALARGAMTAARKLGIIVTRAQVLDVIRSSSNLEECAGRLADLLKRDARLQRVDLAGKVTDP